MPLLQCPLYQATLPWQVEDAHLWMAIPYHSQDQAIQSGWPVRFRPTVFPVPFSDAISALKPHIPDFSLAPPDAVFLQDASWFPTWRHSGGAVAVLDVHTGHYTLHRIPIPIFCDNSYQAQLYVAWVVPRAHACACWFMRDERWSLNDSNSYVTALGSRNDSASPLIASLLTACRSLIKNTAFPRHLYSHLTGTFLDRVMDAVDCLARDVGMSQTPGWIPELQELPVLFTHNDRQIQDFQAFFNKKIPACVLHHLNVPYHPPSPNLLLCERVAMCGSVQWGIHLRTVAINSGLYTPPASATCGMSGATVTPCHYTRECPLLDFFRIAIHTELALAISDFVPRWSVNCVTLSGIQIFYGNSLFGISVGPATVAGPMV